MQRQKGEVCPLCEKGKLSEVKGDFTTEVDGPGGHLTRLIVPGLSWRHCDSCNEDLLNEEASAAITASHRVALKLLTADEIRSIRQNLGKTQGQMSELLGIGERRIVAGSPEPTFSRRRSIGIFAHCRRRRAW